MAILIRCPACDKGFRVRDELEGTTVHCSACDEPIVVAGHGDEEEDRGPPKEPPRGKSGGSSLVLVLALVAGGLFLLCGGAGVGGFLFYRKRNAPVVVTGKDGKLDMRDLGKALEKDLDRKLAPDLGKEIETKLDKVLGPNRAETLPEFTVKPHLVPVSGLPSEVYVPRARRDLVLLGTGGWLNMLAKPDGPGVRIERLDVRARMSLESVEIKLPGIQGVHDVSPDGALIALNNFGFGVDVAVVSLLDGKVLARNWKPVFKHTESDGRTRNLGARGLRFLAANRWLVLYEDDVVEVFTSNGTDWQRVTLRGASAPRKRSFGRNSAAWCVSNDGKTLACWKDHGFDLVDTTTGAVRRTGQLAAESNEKNIEAKTALFSPDGGQLLARVEATRGSRGGSFMVRWDIKGSEPAVRLSTETTLAGFFWWGNGHFVQLGNKRLGWSATVHDAATGKPLADLAHRGGMLVPINPDGKLRFLTRQFGDKEDGFLFQAPFPSKLLIELEKRAATGKLPTLQANSTGLGIRP
jgi:hypothetical protein